MVFISIWLVIFSIPIFLYVEEPKKNVTQKNTINYLIEGFKIIVKNKTLLRYFVARVFYFDALVTIFAFGGIYASKVFNFSQTEILYFAILINDKNLFWLVSFLLGIFIGPLQSSSRVLLTKIIPEERGGQFFGFAIFSGKVTSFLGPLIYGIIATSLNSQKSAMTFVILLFIISIVLIGNKEPDKI